MFDRVACCLKRWRLRCTYWRTVFTIVILTVGWNEYLSYFWARISWSSLPYSDNGDIRILFVADPQLCGYHDVYLPSPSLTDIAVWDADNYLARGFTQAYRSLQPDVVVFLGDLLDEGSTSIDIEFTTTVKRFYRMFRTDPKVQKVFIWGDNDIGGEGFDFRTDGKIQRFMEAFQQKENGEGGHFEWSLQSHKDIDFLKIDQDWGQTFYKLKEDNLKKLVKSSNGRYLILLNHMNVMFNLSPAIMQKILKLTKPSAIFTAHTHYARLLQCSDCDTFDANSGRGPLQKNVTVIKGTEVYKIKLTDTKVTEVMVPTCSYRMGTTKMGYGAAIIDRKGTMYYTVFWLPSRHMHFVLYGMMLVLLVCITVIKAFSTILSSQR